MAEIVTAARPGALASGAYGGEGWKGRESDGVGDRCKKASEHPMSRKERDQSNGQFPVGADGPRVFEQLRVSILERLCLIGLSTMSVFTGILYGPA